MARAGVHRDCRRRASEKSLSGAGKGLEYVSWKMAIGNRRSTSANRVAHKRCSRRRGVGEVCCSRRRACNGGLSRTSNCLQAVTEDV